MITFLELYNECAGQPWSMFDSDAESVDDFESAMKISINKAISYLWNLQPWGFRIKTTSFDTETDNAEYELPSGNIIKKVISGSTKYGIKCNDKTLEYAEDYELLDAASGEPEKFYIYADTLYLYPTPDNAYTVSVEYLSIPYGLNEDGDEIYTLTEENDYINIPEKYEELFKNCVISLAMVYAIASDSDENHSGYQKQYEDALMLLNKYCRNSIVDKKIVI